MADNLNTPSLPEIKPLSRRHVMAGVAALSAVTGLAMTGSAAAAEHPDAELLAACREWWQSHEIEQALWDAASQVDIEAEARCPVLPEALRQPVAVEGEKLLKPQGGEWRAHDLNYHIKHGGMRVWTEVKGPQSKSMMIEDYEYPETTTNRLRELLAMRLEHDRLHDLAMSPCEAAEQTAMDAGDQQSERVQAICSMRARTIEGLLAKAKVLRADDLVFTGDAEDEAWSIFADIEALASGVPS